MNKKNKANWKAKVETGFESLGLVMGRRPWLWLLSCLAAVGVMASQLGRLEKDTSIEGFLEKGSVEIQRYDAFKETFGRDEVFIITYGSKKIIQSIGAGRSSEKSIMLLRDQRAYFTAGRINGQKILSGCGLVNTHYQKTVTAGVPADSGQVIIWFV